MQRFLLVACATNGWLAVALGAFGAHGLKTQLMALPDFAQRMGWWETAASYHLAHALALGLFGLSWGRVPGAWVRWAGVSMQAGIALFSGSLYAMALTGATGLGAITPIGGLGLLLGWGAFAMGAWRVKHLQ